MSSEGPERNSPERPVSAAFEILRASTPGPQDTSRITLWSEAGTFADLCSCSAKNIKQRFFAEDLFYTLLLYSSWKWEKKPFPNWCHVLLGLCSERCWKGSPRPFWHHSFQETYCVLMRVYKLRYRTPAKCLSPAFYGPTSFLCEWIL